MTTLLVDGDLYCFSTAIAFQTLNPFTGDTDFDGTKAKMVLDQRMRKLMARFHTPHIKIFFSCDRKSNWRRQLVKSYKMNREGKMTPIGLPGLISHLKCQYPYVEEDTLEADDLIGLYATDQELCKGKTVICSWDKDFLTIPTAIYNGQKDILKVQSKADALKFLIYQIIVGDTADGYKGITRVGKVGATKFIAQHSKNLYNIWEPLLELAAKKKCDEEYMISQLRMAHILQKDDYDFDTGEVKLINPEDLGGLLE